MKRILCLTSVYLTIMVLLVATGSAQASPRGPEIDILRYKVIKGSAAQLEAMQTSDTDVLTRMRDPTDIETLETAGFTVTAAFGFHICFIGFNIRPDQSYRRPEITFWPLADVDFRHALAHSLDRESIVRDIYGYVVTPVRSLIPPACGAWVNPGIPDHAFNLGDPFTSPPGEESTCGLLKAAGYVFVDADGSGMVTDADYWRMPNGDPLPEMEVLMPREQVDFEKHLVALRWHSDLYSTGLAGTAGNGRSGFTQGNNGMGYDLWPPTAPWVYEDVDFDLYIVNFKLNRFPDHLYDWFHSSQDSSVTPWAYNAFGVNDPTLDGLLETLKFGVTNEEKLRGCYDAQEWLADPRHAQALPTLPVYTMNYVNTFNPNLRGIVNSPSYGSGAGGCVALRELNGPYPSVWTYTNIRWAPGTERTEGGRTIVQWCLGDKPEHLNPLYAGTVAAWEILDRVYDPLITVNPYTPYTDEPWLAQDWDLTLTATGMDVTYYLRDDVYWHDGYQYTAQDAEFGLEFMRDWQIPKYKPAWEPILDVEVIDSATFTVHSDTTSQFLIYDWAVLAALLPPQIWDRPWTSLHEIIEFDPTTGYDLAPGYTAGPHPPPTSLFGTGPYVFQYYDPVIMYSELWANRNYFLETAELHSLKAEMFHEVGDVNRNGYIDIFDLSAICAAFGKRCGQPGYNPEADLNKDCFVDAKDLAMVMWHWGEQREYP